MVARDACSGPLALHLLVMSEIVHPMQNVDTTGLSYRLVDAKGQLVGRLAAQLAVILQVSR